jgi:ABC-type bacteriocin/lantibiotic exporter with double-glycine peptidase domain
MATLIGSFSMKRKSAIARRTIKRLDREQSELVEKHRELRDIHEHKQTNTVKREAGRALAKAGKLGKRAEKLEAVGKGKLV